MNNCVGSNIDLRTHDRRRQITAEMALKLARLIGTDARSWVNLRAHYNLERTEIELAARVKKKVKPHATESEQGRL